jgi:hypothetical protein
MKTSAKIISLIQVVMLTSVFSFAGNKTNTSSDSSARQIKLNGDRECLEVKILPTVDNKVLTGVTITIYQDNDPIIKIANVQVTSKTFLLKQNKQYTIEVSKEGYYSKRVRIATFLPVNAFNAEIDEPYEYDLQMELVKVKQGVQSFFMDFPIALISYNKQNDIFSYNNKYTNHIVREIRKEAGPGFAYNFNQK